MDMVNDSEVTQGQQTDLGDTGQNISVVHVAIPNQAVQVQSVIQPTSQPSVIHTTHQGNTIHVVTEDEFEEAEGKKRREILNRRPSYRKILNELSSDTGGISGMTKITEEDSNSSQEGMEAADGASNLSTSQQQNVVVSATSVAAAGSTVQYQQAGGTVTVVPTHTIQIASHGDGIPHTGVQTLTMSNTGLVTSPGGATIVQYAQGPDGQFFIPATNVQAYQIATPTSLPQGVVMTTAMGSPQGVGEEASRKRELRLLKNREAASECRRKKKEYIKCLENRVAVLENQNKTLMEELKSLKELYCQKDA
ncbi:cAMP-responsive element modulator isoform X1 [Lingula anatina]|uniref:cAMP-responsive element modulator isoform X1 n=1 Tax=Lingula anatina TaxID=7574 RepID=A0A1S3HQJ7_LINAN|nr:cAMP-responsive element modulator isoform X1 [Lingula anatina]XP_013388328.1 cAMP-responsive element modulator isoform X1 [Lingula anatina]|eukprot:XP_013388327.1 cAMP-responsive element modulator isoform X1 [Lingula anatina]